MKLTLSPDAHRLFRERAKEAGLPRSQYLEALLRVGRAPVHVPPGSSATLTLDKHCVVRAAVFEGGGHATFAGPGKITGLRTPVEVDEGRDANFKRGVEAAADIAATYNSSTTHDYRLDDCILCKLNQTKRETPRRNKQRLENPKHAAIRGLAAGLAEVCRAFHSGEIRTAVRIAAKATGVSLDEMRAAGAYPIDLRELKKAGVS